jgi:hypothetical protein
MAQIQDRAQALGMAETPVTANTMRMGDVPRLFFGISCLSRDPKFLVFLYVILFSRVWTILFYVCCFHLLPVSCNFIQMALSEVTYVSKSFSLNNVFRVKERNDKILGMMSTCHVIASLCSKDSASCEM